MRRTPLVIVVALALVAPACTSTDSGVTAVRSAAAPTATPTQSKAALPPDILAGDVIDFGGPRSPRPWDDAIAAYVFDIERFWAAEYDRLTGQPWTPLGGGVHAASADRATPLPQGCGDATASAIVGNAFYCPDGDFIVYDDDELAPLLVEQFGTATLGVVLAHEFGHAIQARTGDLDRPVLLTEQQADYFAGAWVARVARGENPDLAFSDADILDGIVAMISVRDPVFGEASTADSHGTGFDRVGAFQDGFRGGTDRCTTFFEEGREDVLVQVPFSADDLQTQGNLPYDDITTSIGADLDRFWTNVADAAGATFVPPTVVDGTIDEVDGCGGAGRPVAYCDGSNTIVVADTQARQLYATSLPSITGEPVVLGDMSVGYLLAVAYADAAQIALGRGAEETSPLVSDCLTGAWVADIIPPFAEARDLRLSAGDLDEAVLTALLTSDEANDGQGRGAAFDKIDAFRAGVLGGLPACAD